MRGYGTRLDWNTVMSHHRSARTPSEAIKSGPGDGSGSCRLGARCPGSFGRCRTRPRVVHARTGHRCRAGCLTQ
eukprot:13451233-Heterocapsa_arctica.AAC.1